jgi:hypothetical protein
MKAAHTAASTDQALTIYNQGFGVVQETRKLRFALGHNEIQLQGMPQQYVPNSMKVLWTRGDAQMAVTSISFEAASLNGARVLASLEGQPVELKFRSSNGRERWTKGTVLHYLNDKVLLEKDGGKTSLVNTADIVEVLFDAAAIADLSDSNTIVLTADGTAAGGADVRVLYQTRGLGWSAVHSATYDEKAGMLTNFESWASVENRSGAAYTNARLTLLCASLPNQDGREMVYAQAAMAPAGGGGAKRANIRSANVEALGEAKAYQVPGLFSIKSTTPGEQVPLGASQDVPVTREYFVPSLPVYARNNQSDARLDPVSIRLRLVNDQEHKLGRPLPAGDVQIYQLDSHGDAQLTGDATIDHIAVGETFGFVYTTASDVKAERKLVESQEGQEHGVAEPPVGDAPVMRPLSGAAATGGPDVGKPISRPDIVKTPAPADEAEEAPKYRDETWEVTVHNFKTDGTAVDVSVFEELPGKHDILNSSHEFTKERASRYSASVNVPAGDKTTLRYSVRIWED